MSIKTFKNIFSFAIILFPLISFSEKPPVIEANVGQHDSTKIRIQRFVKSINSDFKQLSHDSIRVTLYKTINLAKDISDKPDLIEMYKLLGNFYHINSMGDSSIKYYQKALDLGKEVDYKRYYPDLSYDLTNVLWETGNYNQALEHALMLKDYYENENIIDKQDHLFNILGLIYSRLLDYPSALENYQRAIKISGNNNNRGLLGVEYSNTGNLYFTMEKYIEALNYFEKGIALEKEYEQYSSVGRSYEILGRIYLALDNPSKVDSLLNLALFYNQKSSDLVGFTRTYVALGKFKIYLKDYNSAITYLLKAEDASIKSGSRESQMNAYEQLSIVYKYLNDFKMAYYYHSKFFDLYKTIYSIQDYGSIKRLEDELKVTKNKSEISAIKLRKQSYINLLLSIITLLFITVSILFIVMYIAASKSRKSLLEMNAALVKARKDAENANRLKSNFLRNISHEVRTPINGIIGLTEFIAKESTSVAERQNCLNMVKTNTNQLMSTIENLVELANITTQHIDVCKTSINPKSFISQIFDIYSAYFVDNKDLSFCLSPEGIANIETQSDPELLKKIIIQLIDNAIKFTKKGVITIGYTNDENVVTFFIRDTGIGISKESQELIFESFRQEQESLEREYQGIGIGLTIAKRLSDIIGTRLWFESVKGQGTVFYLSVSPSS